MSRKVYHVIPNGSNWQVKSNRVVLSNHYNKDTVVASGRSLAMANQPSQLVVHLANGQIETEYTYGQDPYPPRG